MHGPYVYMHAPALVRGTRWGAHTARGELIVAVRSINDGGPCGQSVSKPSTILCSLPAEPGCGSQVALSVRSGAAALGP